MPVGRAAGGLLAVHAGVGPARGRAARAPRPEYGLPFRPHPSRRSPGSERPGGAPAVRGRGGDLPADRRYEPGMAQPAGRTRPRRMGPPRSAGRTEPAAPAAVAGHRPGCPAPARGRTGRVRPPRPAHRLRCAQWRARPGGGRPPRAARIAPDRLRAGAVGRAAHPPRSAASDRNGAAGRGACRVRRARRTPGHGRGVAVPLQGGVLARGLPPRRPPLGDPPPDHAPDAAGARRHDAGRRAHPCRRDPARWPPGAHRPGAGRGRRPHPGPCPGRAGTGPSRPPRLRLPPRCTGAAVQRTRRRRGRGGRRGRRPVAGAVHGAAAGLPGPDGGRRGGVAATGVGAGLRGAGQPGAGADGGCGARADRPPGAGPAPCRAHAPAFRCPRARPRLARGDAARAGRPGGTGAAGRPVAASGPLRRRDRADSRPLGRRAAASRPHVAVRLRRPAERGARRRQRGGCRR
ncbi:hypothetical protein BG653_06824 [Streptomyces platensis]|uniref:Uncharacterized protein n=1 Tax=Streptomyces platensis TaxID=58346 RepID=A0ABX3XM56_STRPT|nr:hypothetical protein BG653_06824 [Streptomyces platensis]